MEALSLFRVQWGEHAFLDVGDSLRGAVQAPGAMVGEGEVFVATAAIALDEVEALECGE